MRTVTLLTVAFFGCSDSDGRKEASGTAGADTGSTQVGSGDGLDTGRDDDSGGAVTDPDDTGTPPIEDATVVVLPIDASGDAWDMAYLASIPASAHLNGGPPAVLAVADSERLKVGTQDLLDRLDPGTIIAPADMGLESSAELVHLTAVGAATWSLAMAEHTWARADHAVFVAEDDYSAGIVGASLASLIDSPMFLVGADTGPAEGLAEALGAQSISLGMDSPSPTLAGAHVALDGASEVIAWLADEGLDVDYIAVTNTSDRSSGRSQKASMVASMFAANRGGLSIPVALAMPTEVVSDGGEHPVLPLLDDVYDDLGHPPRHLAIVGAHDALPQMRKPTIFDNPLPEQPVSDLPYGQIDDDAFLDISIGRIIGDTPEELSVIATRTAQYDRLRDGVWERKIVEAGLWGFDELRAINENAQFDTAVHLSEEEIGAAGSLEIGAFLHKDHSYCQVLGHAVDVATPTLFAPAITLSRGCSVGGMDLLREFQRSIVDHLFGQGIVAFVGAARNAIAYNTIIEVSLWNQLLEGHTLGDAFKHGINDAIVHWLDDGSVAMRYAIDTEIVYGDPAFRLHVPGPFLTQPARQDFDGLTLTVHAPELWTAVEYHPEMLAEWGYGGDLYMYTGPGAIPRTYWAGAYDNEDMYFGVQLPLDSEPTTVTELGTYSDPLGWGGGVHMDHHHDGTVSAMWRIRLIDFDPETGTLAAEAPSFSYAVE